MNSRLRLALAVVVGLVVVSAAAWWAWRAWVPATSAPAVTAAPPTTAPPGPAASPPSADPRPVGPPVTTAATPAAASPPPTVGTEATLSPPELSAALVDLAGSRAAAALLQTTDFARRFVATVDNLGRAHAAPLLWPVTPAEGRFTTESRDGGEVIAVANGQRYAALVALAEAVEPAAAASLYRRIYPQLQQAYADLGFPNRAFHTRLIEVIDLLLTTPTPSEPAAVMLTEVKGPIPSTRPWVRYEFVDPALQSLSAGQKMLVRTGPVQQKRLMARLVAFRAALVTMPASATPR